PAATVKPELILVNGNIHTMDPANLQAQAVAIADGRFLAVGTNAEIANLPSAGVAKIDLGGRTVTPGFIDAHLHTASSGLRHLKEVNCDLRSIAAIQAALRDRAAKRIKGGALAWLARVSGPAPNYLVLDSPIERPPLAQ